MTMHLETAGFCPQLDLLLVRGWTTGRLAQVRLLAPRQVGPAAGRRAITLAAGPLVGADGLGPCSCRLLPSADLLAVVAEPELGAAPASAAAAARRRPFVAAVLPLGDWQVGAVRVRGQVRCRPALWHLDQWAEEPLHRSVLALAAALRGGPEPTAGGPAPLLRFRPHPDGAVGVLAWWLPGPLPPLELWLPGRSSPRPLAAERLTASGICPSLHRLRLPAPVGAALLRIGERLVAVRGMPAGASLVDDLARQLAAAPPSALPQAPLLEPAAIALLQRDDRAAAALPPAEPPRRLELRSPLRPVEPPGPSRLVLLDLGGGAGAVEAIEPFLAGLLGWAAAGRLAPLQLLLPDPDPATSAALERLAARPLPAALGCGPLVLHQRLATVLPLLLACAAGEHDWLLIARPELIPLGAPAAPSLAAHCRAYGAALPAGAPLGAALLGYDRSGFPLRGDGLPVPLPGLSGGASGPAAPVPLPPLLAGGERRLHRRLGAAIAAGLAPHAGPPACPRSVVGVVAESALVAPALADLSAAELEAIGRLDRLAERLVRATPPHRWLPPLPLIDPAPPPAGLDGLRLELLSEALAGLASADPSPLSPS